MSRRSWLFASPQHRVIVGRVRRAHRTIVSARPWPRRNPTHTPQVGLRCANPTYQLTNPGQDGLATPAASPSGRSYDQGRYDLFGGLPDTIKDDWIDDLETLGERMDQFIEVRRTVSGFDLRYHDSIRPSDDAWRDCSAVLARRDLDNLMRQGWGG
jgi:hypothetical protein